MVKDNEGIWEGESHTCNALQETLESGWCPAGGLWTQYSDAPSSHWYCLEKDYIMLVTKTTTHIYSSYIMNCVHFVYYLDIEIFYECISTYIVFAYHSILQ